MLLRSRVVLSSLWCLGCAVAGGSAVAEAAAPDELGAPDRGRPTDVMRALREQLEAREFAAAERQAEQVAAEIEARSGRYAAALAGPLTVVGDARMGLGDAEGALEIYDRAKHIVRISGGVQGLAQLPLLYREAAALAAVGKRRTANARHEFAYSLKMREFGRDDPRMIPARLQLVKWYREQYRFRPAQVLYESLIEHARANYPPNDRRTIDLLRAYADTYRQSRFGGRKAGRGGFRAWPPGEPLDPPWHETASFTTVRRTLREVLKMNEARPEATDVELASALIDLGDWHLLHYDSGVAISYYRRAWRQLDGDEAARQRAFGDPQPLFLPLPRSPARSAGRGTREGVVKLSLNITHRGDVVGRKTLVAEPDNIMEFRVRKAARRARYRPAFAAAEPVAREDFELEYRYHYAPGDLALARRRP